MNNLLKANEARKENALNKLWNFENYGVTSFKKLIDKGVFVKSDFELVPELQFDRRKSNRMSNWNGEQEAYEKRCTEKTKKSYSLYYDERISTEVSIYVFEYYNETRGKEKCSECQNEMNEMDHNYGTEDILVCIHCYQDAQF